jgi:hypothetical protein
VGREDRHLHQRRPHGAPVGAATSTSSSTSPAAWGCRTRTASRS